MRNYTPEYRHAAWISELGNVYCQTLICLIGAILNTINCIVFTRKQFNSSTYILMLALSVADGLTLAIRFPQGILWCITGKWCKRFVSSRLYNYSIFVDVPLTNMTETISVWITVALALERYIAMRHYNLSKTRCTVKNSQILAFVIAVVAILFNMPFFFLYNTHKVLRELSGNQTVFNVTRKNYVVITKNTDFGRSVTFTTYSWIRLIIVQFLPLLFLCVFNCLLLILVARHNRKFYDKATKQRKSAAAAVPLTSSCADTSATAEQQGNNAGAQRPRSASNVAPQKRMHRAQNKLTILLIAIIALFLGGQIPQAFSYHSIFPLFKSCPGLEKELSNCPNYIIYRMVCQNLGNFSYSANFFIYLFLNKHFQQALAAMFCPRSGCFQDKMMENHQENLELTSKAQGHNCHLAVPTPETHVRALPASH